MTTFGHDSGHQRPESDDDYAGGGLGLGDVELGADDPTVHEPLDAETATAWREAAAEAEAFGAAAAAEDAAAETAPAPVFGDVTSFVEEFLAPVFGRDVTHGQGLTWCPEWWRHPEAVYRLESLWRSWEQLRLDPAMGSSVWLRDHLDHHLPVLLSIGGPFLGCGVHRGHQGRDYTLPVTSPYDREPASPDPDRAPGSGSGGL